MAGLGSSSSRSTVITAATRKKPGRVTGKQSGSKYYQNYLRNRQAKGGEFLGPPLLQVSEPLVGSQEHQLPAAQQQALLQQQKVGLPEQSHPQHHQQDQQARPLQQDLDTANAQQDLSTTTELQQQAQQHGALPSELHPDRLHELLQQCLAAVAPLQPQQLTTPAEQPESQQQQLVPQQQLAQQQQQQQQSPVDLLRQRSKQHLPWQCSDYVSPDLAGGALRLLKKRSGVTVEQPELPHAQPSIPVPPLPNSGKYGPSALSLSSSTTTTTSSSSSSSHPTPVPTPAHKRVLHVFWDVSSLHPGGLDPRVVVAQLRRVLGCYGEVAGFSAFGIQKLFNWIPEAFMLQYAPDRLPGRKRTSSPEPFANIQSQQQEVQQLLQQATRAGVSLEDSLGPLRCRVCGRLRDNYRQLHVHMVQRHKQAAPPLEKLLPQGALAAMLSAAIAATGSTGSSSGGGGGSGLQMSAPRSAAGGAAAARQQQQQQEGSSTWKVADPWAMRNSSTRTLGRVSSYFNSRGDQFIPPDGHQISLKYVLAREGVEVRLVQRKERAVAAAVADSLHRFLHGQLLTRTAEEVQQQQDVLVVVSDRETHAAVLQQARRMGVPSIAVCGKLKRHKAADVTLRWQWVAAGRYECQQQQA